MTFSRWKNLEQPSYIDIYYILAFYCIHTISYWRSYVGVKKPGLGAVLVGLGCRSHEAFLAAGKTSTRLQPSFDPLMQHFVGPWAGSESCQHGSFLRKLYNVILPPQIKFCTFKWYNSDWTDMIQRIWVVFLHVLLLRIAVVRFVDTGNFHFDELQAAPTSTTTWA